MKHGKTLWMEDDCAPDTEQFGQAFERLFGRPFKRDEVTDVDDEGDGEWLKLSDGTVCYLSYPGNSAIYAAA